MIRIREEPWAAIVDDFDRLGAVHHAEGRAGRAGVYRLDREMIQRLADAGMWRVFVARVDGALAGYCCWMPHIQLEEEHVPTMTQGPFYVAPQHARHRLGLRLLRASRDALAAEGCKVLRVGHSPHGRGARLGRLYAALGAVEHQREYLWRI